MIRYAKESGIDCEEPAREFFFTVYRALLSGEGGLRLFEGEFTLTKP